MSVVDSVIEGFCANKASVFHDLCTVEVSVVPDFCTVTKHLQRDFCEWWPNLDPDYQAMVIWCSSGLLLRMLAHFVPPCSANAIRGVPVIGEHLAHALKFMFNGTTCVLFILCFPRGGLQQYMCTEYKTKSHFERRLYAVCLWSQAFCKPTNSWPLDLIGFVLQGSLIAENERERNGDTFMELHSHRGRLRNTASQRSGGCLAVDGDHPQALGRFRALLQFSGVHRHPLHGSKALCESTTFMVFQHVFILSCIALKLFEGYGPFCHGQEGNPRHVHALVQMKEPLEP